MFGEFWFKDASAASVGIVAAGGKRVVKATANVVEYNVSGRDGTVLYEIGTYAPFELEVAIVVKKTDTKSVREIVRQVGYFLQGTGSLVFSDEPDKEYIATVVDEVPLEELSNFGKATVTFHCQPFAQSIEYRQVLDAGVTFPVAEQITAGGTRETPCIINITATSTITGLTITYER